MPYNSLSFQAVLTDVQAPGTGDVSLLLCCPVRWEEWPVTCSVRHRFPLLSTLNSSAQVIPTSNDRACLICFFIRLVALSFSESGTSDNERDRCLFEEAEVAGVRLLMPASV